MKHSFTLPMWVMRWFLQLHHRSLASQPHSDKWRKNSNMYSYFKWIKNFVIQELCKNIEYDLPPVEDALQFSSTCIYKAYWGFLVAKSAESTSENVTFEGICKYIQYSFRNSLFIYLNSERFQISFLE